MSIDLTDSTTTRALAAFFAIMRNILSEKHFRLLLGAFLIYVLGARCGNIERLSEFACASRNTIGKAKREMKPDDLRVFSDRIRRKGAGRKTAQAKHPGIADSIARMIERRTWELIETFSLY